METKLIRAWALQSVMTLAIVLSAAACAQKGASSASAERVADAPASRVAVEAPAATAPAPEPAAQGEPPAEEPVSDSAPSRPAPPVVRMPETGDDASLSCESDSDCAIKDVGSCCGYNPRCVNKDSPTFPEQVKAQCAKNARVGICGFPSISGCSCVAGKCAAIPGQDGGELVQ